MNLKPKICSGTSIRLEWVFISLLLACYLVPRLLGCTMLGMYGKESGYMAFLFHPFFHLSVTHLILNMIAFVGMIVGYRHNNIFFVCDFFWSWALSLLAAHLVVDITPVMGASSLVFAWLGIGYFSYLVLPVTLNRKAFIRYSACLSISLVVGFLHPGINGLLHLVAFFLGGMKCFCSVFRRNFRALMCVVGFFAQLSCSTTKELKITEQQKEQTSQNNRVQTDEVVTQEWDRWKNEQLDVDAQEIYFSTDTSFSQLTCPPVTKIVRYKVRYNTRDTAQMRSTTTTKEIATQQQEKITENHISTLEKEKTSASAFGLWLPLLLITIVILFIWQLIKFKR